MEETAIRDTRTIESSKFNALAANNVCLQGVLIETVDYKGRVFDRFFVERNSYHPGWYVFGRNPGYGDHLVYAVARPNKPERKYPNRNGKMHAGWPRKRDAQVVADAMNGVTA